MEKEQGVMEKCEGCGHMLPKSYFDNEGLCYLCDTPEEVETIKKRRVESQFATT